MNTYSEPGHEGSYWFERDLLQPLAYQAPVSADNITRPLGSTLTGTGNQHLLEQLDPVSAAAKSGDIQNALDRSKALGEPMGGSNSLLKSIARGGAAFLGQTYKNLDKAKWGDLWSNAKFHNIGSKVRSGWSGLQGVTMFLGGLSTIQPYMKNSLSIDQAQAMSAIKGIRWTLTIVATTAGAGVGSIGGPAGAVAGAVSMGLAMDYIADVAERKIYKWAGWSK